MAGCGPGNDRRGGRQRIGGRHAIVVSVSSRAGERKTKSLDCLINGGAVEIGIVAQLIAYSATIKEIEDSVAAAKKRFRMPQQAVSNTEPRRPITAVCEERAEGEGGVV